MGHESTEVLIGHHRRLDASEALADRYLERVGLLVIPLTGLRRVQLDESVERTARLGESNEAERVDEGQYVLKGVMGQVRKLKDRLVGHGTSFGGEESFLRECALLQYMKG